MNILIVGHCGFDGPRLAEIVKKSGHVPVLLANKELVEQFLEGNKAALMLVNRLFDDGSSEGIPFIEEMKETHPEIKQMLVSNYPESQKEAERVGAEKGFGKAMDDEEIEERIHVVLG